VRLLKSDSRRAKRSATRNDISDDQTALHFDQISGELSGGLFNRAPNSPRTLDGLEPVVLGCQADLSLSYSAIFSAMGSLTSRHHMFSPQRS
jgi:hypothetical protein